MNPTWYFCRTCGYRGQFVAKPEEPVRCPECRKRYVTTIMRRQDVGEGGGAVNLKPKGEAK